MMQMPPPFSRSRILPALMLIPMLMVLTACDGSAETTSQTTTKSVLTVTVVTPERRSVPLSIAASGAIAAWQEAIISPEANGLRVEKLLAEEGDVVRKGQPLAEFSHDTVMNNYLLAIAERNEANALAQNAQADALRARKLRGTGTLSEQDIHKLLTQELATKARLESAKARVDAQKIYLDQTVLRAPDDGVISSRLASIGSVPGQNTEMFRLIRQGRFEWRAELSAEQLEKVFPGQKAQITSPGGHTWNGVVRLASTTIDASSRRGIAYVDILSHEIKDSKSVRPGSWVNGEIVLGDHQRWSVPQSAIIARDGYHQVFIVNDNLQVKALKVSVGRVLDDRQEIDSGLNGTEQIVASGGVFLHSGDTVQVDDGVTSPGRVEEIQEANP
ncbi:efflux RND transporter periplasmic adaptor subunit [Klebsiella aerogenes]|uniref:efflux RND transporter periplasmic adaptor subunit n=1 Tax=Klebsiella aerogenes TaxID=548 RepID=UPI002A800EC2|nr:efflux RND transporter periplasmic adaptor subunit [Klebsiella aerogenes]WPS06562.1 efflux RND transporter periplasmic adaptor subunit [Klebsiella aerogenes]